MGVKRRWWCQKPPPSDRLAFQAREGWCGLEKHSAARKLRRRLGIGNANPPSHISSEGTLSTVRSGPMQTEPNPQDLGSVLCEGGPDPYFQVQGPSLSGPDLRVEPGSDLVQTSKWKEISESKVSE